MRHEEQPRLACAGIVITGGSMGIGRSIAEHCVRAGADVLICARGEVELARTRQQLTLLAHPEQRIAAVKADVGDLHSAEQVIATASSELRHFTGLVNCAGINGPKGRLDEIRVEDWVETVRVSLIGTMTFCRAAIPYFRRQEHGRIVNLSGGGATSARPFLSAYAAAKTAVVRLTENLAEELEGDGILVNAIAPGAVNTRLLDDVLEAGPEKIGAAAFASALKQRESGGTPPERAAELCLFLLSRESEGISGRLISAVWDHWEDLPRHARELAKTDIYTLRRIVPRDRSFEWG